ncbi:High mobility group B protein 4 [Bienertia sinuspersici]
MGKRASNSRQEVASTPPTSTSWVTGETSTSTPHRKITLRIKSSRNLSKKVVEDEKSEKETKPRSSKRSKSSLKKKIDPNKPKKPPTAFFYFLLQCVQSI